MTPLLLNIPHSIFLRINFLTKRQCISIRSGVFSNNLVFGHIPAIWHQYKNNRHCR